MLFCQTFLFFSSYFLISKGINHSMRRNKLLVFSIVFALIGLVVLFFLKPDVSPQYLELSGEVSQISQDGAVSFIDFIPKDFLVVSFNEAELEGNVTLVGRLQEYKGRVEFVVDSWHE